MESEDKLNREKLVISDLCLEYLFIKSIINYDQYVDIHNRIKKFQEDNHVIVNLNQLSSARFYYNDDPDKSKTLKVKLITSSMNTFKRGDIYLRSLEDSLFEIPQYTRNGRDPVQIISSGPDSKTKMIHDNYLRLIHRAQDHVYIQTPYFIPDDSILDALKIAAKSGVDVRIMIPCKPDHPFVYWATYSYIGEMVAAGAKCYVYNNGFLHAKTLSIDGMVACVGTANMDFRSFGLNFEVNAVIYSERTVQRLERAFENDMTLCTQVTRKVYDERGLVIKAKEQFSRLLSPLL